MVREAIIHEFLGVPAVFASDSMLVLLERIQKVAATNATVLITGESGSGKEMVARAIHHYSLRNSRPWVDVNCGAFPEHLIESELFGHDRGAFSGADVAKPGLFELADTGTLFLDEIGELEPRMQVKLLRVLDGAPYYRLGGTRKISVDVRVLAATNRELEEAVREGRFRKDLLHRLEMVRLEVPPLRRRTSDIRPLAERFLAIQNPEAQLSDEAVDALEAYEWPGNIRELRNVMTQVGIFLAGKTVRRADLPAKLHEAQVRRVVPISEGSSIDQMEREMILQTLAQTGGHQQKAAELLGISRRTLSRKLKLYDMEEIAG